jgi:AraC family transcriptional regulator, arabinose operon regulatory protein
MESQLPDLCFSAMLSGMRVKINSAGTVLCEPTWRWDVRAGRMPDFDLWHVWAGVGTMTHDAGESTRDAGGSTHDAGGSTRDAGGSTPTSAITPVHRGRTFVLRPGEAYSGRHDPRRRLGVCFVHFDYLNARGRRVRPADAELPPLHYDVKDPDGYERLARRIVQLYEDGSREAAERLLESVLLSVDRDRLVDHLPFEQQRREERIADVMRHVRENPGELFSIELLADRAGYAPDHFAKLFARVAGVGPKEFCIRARLARAQQLLRSSDLSVIEISQMLGYADVYFFSRQFKTRTGQTPTAFRGTAEAP